MIPILYDVSEKAFTSGGIGFLTDCESCKVTEEVNGIYECEFTYPVTGRLYSELTNNPIIYVKHDTVNGPQPFDIYAHSKPINGLVTFDAHHISYRLSNAVAKPFIATTAVSAMYYLNQPEYTTTNDFVFSTDLYGDNSFSINEPTVIREILLDDKYSLLTKYGYTGGMHAEYLFDHFNVQLLSRRGVDTDITIRYGKDLVDLEDKLDSSESFNAVVPYWVNPDDEADVVVLSSPLYVHHDDGLAWIKAIPLDMSQTLNSRPTEETLRAAALAELEQSMGWKPYEELTINAIQLSEDSEYEQFKDLQRLQLGDTIRVVANHLGVNLQERVVKLVYDALRDKYEEITIGDLPLSYKQTIN